MRFLRQLYVQVLIGIVLAILLGSVAPDTAKAGMSFTVRAAGTAESLVEPVRHAVALLDKDLPVSKLRPLDTLVATGRTRTRFTATACSARPPSAQASRALA